MKRKERILPQDTIEEIMRLYEEGKMTRTEIAAKYHMSPRKIYDIVRFHKLDTKFTRQETEFLVDYLEHNKDRGVISVSELRKIFPNKPEYTIRNKRDSIYKKLNPIGKQKGRNCDPDLEKIFHQRNLMKAQQYVNPEENSDDFLFKFFDDMFDSNLSTIYEDQVTKAFEIDESLRNQSFLPDAMFN